MKSEIYKINNNIERIQKGRNTLFLDGKELKLVTSKLKKSDYKVYYPYKESEKVILYVNDIPKVILFKINAMGNLRHQDILGSLFSLNIDSCYFGDIVLYQGYFYVFISSELSNFVKENLTMIGKNKVLLEEVSLLVLDNYKRLYEEKEMITSSLRIDTIVSNIINSSRKVALDKIKDKEVIVNYEVITKNSYCLRKNDIFSIRKYGKYKFIGIIKSTKKNNFIVKYLKYM